MHRTRAHSGFRLVTIVTLVTCGLVARPSGAQGKQEALNPTPPVAPKVVVKPGYGRLAWSSPVGETQLDQALGALLNKSVSSGRWGVIVVSLSRGDTLFGYNADSALLPASTMKVFTSAMALDYLGP